MKKPKKTAESMKLFLSYSKMEIANHTECPYCIDQPIFSFKRKKVVHDYPHGIAYSKIDESEITLYHGTYLKNVDSILANGFNTSYSSDISFGKGIYLTPCPYLAASFSDAVILECKVKPGNIKHFETFCCRQGCDQCQYNENITCNALSDLTEYNLSDVSRILVKSIVYFTHVSNVGDNNA
jgi:hypothetical protein